jgi:hypothetical protein
MLERLGAVRRDQMRHRVTQHQWQQLVARNEMADPTRPKSEQQASRGATTHAWLLSPTGEGSIAWAALFYPHAPMQCRALAQPQHGTRSAHGRGTPPTQGQYPMLAARAQGSGVPFHQAPLWGSNWSNFGWSSTAMHSQGHNSLLPRPPDLLKTPTDAE